MNELTLTPTRNIRLPQMLGGFPTLSLALDYAAQGETGVNFYNGFGQLQQSLPYRTLRDSSLAVARQLLALNLPRGTRLGMIAETGPEFLTAFYACQYVGLTPCPLPFAVYLGGKEAYIAQLNNMLRVADAPLLLSPQSVLDCALAAASPLGSQALGYHELPPAVEQSQLEPWQADDVAYVQFSSGSTSQPKGVLISQQAVSANTTAILRHGMRLRPDDRAFSWLPLYHDMGLVGFSIAAVAGQCSVDYLAPTAFARRPMLWLQLMSDNSSSITYSPSFGYRLSVQRYKDEPLDLSRLRIAGIGGDMIRPQILDAFTERLAACGFRPTAFLPSYGMAETTLAISVADDNEPPLVDTRADSGRQFVGCGRPLPGYEVSICNENHQPVPDGEIGHLWVRGPSLMQGYLNNPQATEEMIHHDGFLNTGDLGYRHNGQLIVTGRAKDLILMRGRNIWPQDIEWAVEHIPPLREGDAAAIGVDSGQDEDELIVLVQCRLSDLTARKTLRETIQSTISQNLGITGRIVLVAPHSLPFTSSGKLSRATARTRYLAGEFDIYEDSTDPV